MTSGKAALLTASLVGVVALGVVATPTIRNHWSNMNTPAASASAPAADSAPTPVKAKHPAHRATPSREAMTTKKETGKPKKLGGQLLPIEAWASLCLRPNQASGQRYFDSPLDTTRS